MKKISHDFIINRNYLQPGKYVYRRDYNCFLLNDKDTANRADSIFAYRSLKAQKKSFCLKDLIKTCIEYFAIGNLCVKNPITQNDEAFKGAILFHSGNLDQLSTMKIFDFDREEVMTLFSSKAAYAKATLDYEYFSPHFSMPLLKYQDDNRLVTIEEFIDFRSGYEDNDQYYGYVMNEVLKDSLRYFEFVKQAHLYQLRTPSELLEDFAENDELLISVWSDLNGDLKHIKFPFLNLHGDLRIANILINQEDDTVKYIDFEYAESFVVFYDVFKMIFNEHENNFNDLYRTHFMNGEYDKYLADIFNIFGLKYCTQLKREYFKIFFINYFANRWKDLGVAAREQQFAEYRHFMSYLDQ